MASTAHLTISSTVVNLPEGGTDNLSISLSNSSAVGSWQNLGATTVVGTAVAVSVPSSGKYLIVIPESTNTFPLRLTGSTAETGMLLSSQGASLLSVVGGSTYHIYTTGGTTVPCRVGIY